MATYISPQTLNLAVSLKSHSLQGRLASTSAQIGEVLCINSQIWKLFLKMLPERVYFRLRFLYEAVDCYDYEDFYGCAGSHTVDNNVEGKGSEVPYLQHDEFGNTENLPQGDINWVMLDTWWQDLELAHFDPGLTVEVSGNNEAVNLPNLPDVGIDVPDVYAQWSEDPDMGVVGHGGADGNLVINLEGGDGEDNELADGVDNELADGVDNGGQLLANELPGANIFEMGLQHLRNSDARLLALIDAHPQLPIFDGHNMTRFQKLVRALIEEGGSPASRPTRYHELGVLCLNDVNPILVAALGVQQLVEIGVQGQFKAQAILTFAASFGNNNDDEIDQLENLTSANLYHRFYMVNGVGPYYALYMLIFGMGRLDFMPAHEMALRRRIERHYHGFANANYETWNPYQGLAAWLIWTHVQRYGG